jgi:hypothetical protein
VDTRLKEHHRHIRLENPDKLAVAEPNVNWRHHIQFHNAYILAIKTLYMDNTVKEASEIELHPTNMNREAVLSEPSHGNLCAGCLKKLSENDTISTRVCGSHTVGSSCSETD